jgi:hypothetical protein
MPIGPRSSLNSGSADSSSAPLIRDDDDAVILNSPEVNIQ